MQVPEPIDVVITWVDGHDPRHQAKLNHQLNQLNIPRPEGAHPTRYNQCDELRYCVHSIFHFAPWVRDIYIVTDDQIPPLMHDLAQTAYAQRVKLVDHRDLFKGYEHYLPTFNSVSIETFLWQINGLSTRFLYFNDDCLLIRPVQPQDFFRQDKVVLRGRWKRFFNMPSRMHRLRFKRTLPSHQAMQENTARLLGFTTQFFDLPHVPFPLDKLILKDLFEQHTAWFEDNCRYPFRDTEQFWSISFFYHAMILAKKVIIDNRLKEMRIHGSAHSEWRLYKKIGLAHYHPSLAFLCLQSMDLLPAAKRAWLFKKLSLKFVERVLLVP